MLKLNMGGLMKTIINKLVSTLNVIVFTMLAMSSVAAHAEYYMVPAPQQYVETAFADCDCPKHINVERTDYKGAASYKQRNSYSISTYRVATCQTWGYVWVPTQCDECGEKIPGHYEERYGFYYYPEMSSTTYTDTYYDDYRPNYDRATGDDLSANIGD
jgi:hypothetical protein